MEIQHIWFVFHSMPILAKCHLYRAQRPFPTVFLPTRFRRRRRDSYSRRMTFALIDLHCYAARKLLSYQLLYDDRRNCELARTITGCSQFPRKTEAGCRTSAERQIRTLPEFHRGRLGIGTSVAGLMQHRFTRSVGKVLRSRKDKQLNGI